MMKPPVTDDQRVVDALSAAVLVRAAASVHRSVWSAARQSRVADAAAAAWDRWCSLSSADRRFAAGVAMISAGLTTLILTATYDFAPGWLWLAPPAMIVSVGLLVLWSSARPGTAPPT